MKKTIIAILASLSFASAASATTCYQLSRDGQSWSRTPEVLCVTEGFGAADESTITLETGLFNRRVVATYTMDLLQRARCIDCNQDVFGVSNPSNSIFNEMQIVFDGEGMGEDQTGTVAIGANEFFYRWFSAN